MHGRGGLYIYIYIYIYTAWFQKATKSALPGWELKYASETILFRLQLFQCNVKIHLIRSIPDILELI